MSTQLHVLQPFGHFTLVMCPGCSARMILKETHPAPFTGDIYTAKYHCQECGTETLREFRRDGMVSEKNA